MNAREVQELLMENFRAKSHHEYREYLGMSGIGRCPRELYFRFMDPQPPDDRLTWYSMAGYALEAKVVERLQVTGHDVRQVSRELVADFDDRYRGHTDHELPDGTLIEIKTINWKGYLRVFYAGMGKRDHVAQCQAYMRHGGFPHCVLVYTPRDIPHREWDTSPALSLPFLTLDVRSDRTAQDKLDAKAQRILKAIDNSSPPPCLCGYCKR